MSLHSQKGASQIDSWRRNVCDVAEKSIDHRVKKVLLDLKNLKGNDEEYLREVAQKFNELACIKLEMNDLEVLNLICDMMKVSSSNILICVKFAKINFKLFYNNIELTKSTSFLENFISTLCTLIVDAFDPNRYNQVESKKFAKVQLCIIIELQNMYSVDQFLGNEYIASLFIKLLNSDICDLEEQFQRILNNLLSNPGFYQDVFSVQDDVVYGDFLRYCLMITQTVNAQDLVSSIMTTNPKSSFLCRLISSLSNHLAFMDTESDNFELILQEITELIAQCNIKGHHFDILEKYLLDGLIGDEYGLSVSCFNIMCRYLMKIEEQATMKSYFLLFQDLLLLMWNPCLEFSEMRQVYLAILLKMLHKMSGSSLTSIINPNLKTFFGGDNQKMFYDWIEDFQNLKNNPTAENYYQLVDVFPSSTQNSSKELGDLIELVGRSDWDVFSSIVIKIIELITNLKDQEKKMMFLLKFNPLAKGQDISLEIAYKLLKMLLTFMPKAGGLDGLKSYVKKLLDVLLERDISVKRLYLNLRTNKTVMIKEEETIISNIEDILKTSNTVSLSHVCGERKQILCKIEPTQLENLEKMLNYAKCLSKQKLSSRELEIVDDIILNLQKVR